MVAQTRDTAQKPRRTTGIFTALARLQAMRARGELTNMLAYEEARQMLGISKSHMCKLVRLGPDGGGLATYRSPVDERVKLIVRADVERLLQARPSAPPVRAPATG